MAESQMSGSIKPFIHGAVTQEEQAGASEEHTQQRKPWAFILSQAL